MWPQRTFQPLAAPGGRVVLNSQPLRKNAAKALRCTVLKAFLQSNTTVTMGLWRAACDAETPASISAWINGPCGWHRWVHFLKIEVQWALSVGNRYESCEQWFPCRPLAQMRRRASPSTIGRTPGLGYLEGATNLPPAKCARYLGGR